MIQKSILKKAGFKSALFSLSDFGSYDESRDSPSEYYRSYNDEIEKRISKPDIVHIPERYIELEPEKPLTEYERMEKEKRVSEIKKVIARQSLQDFQINEQYNHYNKATYNNYYDYHSKFEQEKRAREQVQKYYLIIISF